MEKLELKHIAPYLPYGLKIQCEWNADGFGGKVISEVTTFFGSVIYFKPKIITVQTVSNDIILDRAEMSDPDTKLLLRPLSDLIKPLPSGEIPLVELAKIEGRVDTSDPNYLLSELKNPSIYAAGVKFKIENDDDDNKWDVFGYDTRYGFGRHFRPSLEQSSACNQLQLFEYLYANMFDIHGLIEKGLAVNIEEIETKK